MKNAITRSICCDIIIPLRNYERFIHLLKKTINKPQWLRHNFIVITDCISAEDEKKMHDWYYDTRVKQAIPEVSIVKCRKESEGHTPSLHNSGIVIGDNPYVYFQDEKDELPINIDKAIYYLDKNPNIYIATGKCETFLNENTPIEIFPMTTVKGEFLYDCEKGSKLFPSYTHPLASVIRKSVFNKEPYIKNDRELKEFSYYDFILRCINNKNVGIKYLPYTLKISNRKKEHAIVMGPKLRETMVNDIKVWIEFLPQDEFKTFQQEILNLLENGEITTFKEIDARIEDHLDSLK